MRLKTLTLCSMPIAMLAVSAPADAQTAQPTPETPAAAPAQEPEKKTEGEQAAQPQETPPSSNPMAAPPTAADPQAVQPAQPSDPALVAGTEENPEFVEEMVVIGLQRSMQQAQTIKRDAPQIADTVVAQDIGKLPDVTVSETAARIPGVQVTRERGEAAGQVLVRGLPDTTTTYNGREIFTAETRNVALGDFPSGGISALSIYKSTTADQIEGGLAGLIDVRSHRPFNFDGFSIAAASWGTYASQSNGFDPNGNILVTDRWTTGVGELGALVNFSYNRLNYLDSARWDSGDIGTFRASDTGEEFRAPSAVGIFYGEGKRERPSVNGSAQWRPMPGLEFYVDGLWQGYRDGVSDRLLEMRLPGNGLSGVTMRQGTNHAQSLTAAGGGALPFMFQGATARKTDTYQFAVGSNFERGPLRISADIARTDSAFDMSLYSFDQRLATAPGFNVNFDVPTGPGGAEFTPQNFDLSDPANFQYLGFFDRSFIAAGDDWQVRTDVDMDTGVSFLPTVEAGLRYTTRLAYQENAQRYSTAGQGTPLTGIPVELHVFDGGFRGSDVQQAREWVVPTYSSLRDNADQIRAIAGFPAGAPERQRTFEADEQTIGGYGQVRYALNLAGVPVDGAVGLRVVRTNTSVTTFLAEGDNELGSGGYTDLLPNASARIRFTPGLQLRLSGTATRTRPGFEQMRPIIFNPPPPCLEDPNRGPDCQLTGSGGNPELEPVRSTNVDASLEYFFAQTGMASLAVFRRDITGFITNLEVTRDDPTHGPGRVRVNIPVNGGEGSIQGFEASVGSFLDVLPGWLGGFGAQANLTYLADEQAFPTGFGLALGEEGRIPNVSKWSYNLVAMYEYEKLSARVAYNYRSRWITQYVQNPNGDGFTGEFVNGVARLDFSAGYKVLENLNVNFNATNILGSPFRNFRQFTPEGDTYPRDVRYEESVYTLGLHFRI